MIIATGATSQSIDIRIVDDDGLPVTGLVAATIGTIKYSLAGANADATISLSDLATIGTAWASGGLKERGEGVYRLDLPDAALATAGQVTVRAEATGKRLICPVITVQAAALTAATTRAALGMAAADLDTQLDAILANTGTGARTVTLTVNDGTTALEGARVRMIKGGENYVGATNASGQIVFSLDDGTWSVAISLAGYTFTPTTLSVSATTSHTYSMTAVNISASSTNLVTGYLYALSTTGAVESGVVVYCTAVQPGVSVGFAHDQDYRSATSAVSGLVQFTNLVPGMTYKFMRGTGPRSFQHTIPEDATSPYELPSIIGE